MLVITDFGAPVPNISPTITMRRSNEILDVQQDGLDAGIVTIIDDSHRSRLFTGGDSLLVALTRDSWSRSVDFIVGLDQACDCHVTKISGPSILMWP
jgi:hypothetical protein